MRAAFALLTGVAVGCYSPPVRDCYVACSTDGACPSGLECVAGMCRSEGEVDPCRFDADADADADPACSFTPGVTTGPKVRVVYLVPSDREVDPRYRATLETAIRHVQLWLRDRMPDLTSFEVHEPVVEVVDTAHPASYYASHETPSDPNYEFWDNVTADAFELTGGSFGDGQNLWLYYIAADAVCDQLSGGGVDHVAIFSENDLRGLVGAPRVAPCGGEPDAFGRCRWVGGMAKHLVESLGVSCQDTGCDGHLTGIGYLTYPSASLDEDDLAQLSDSGFMRAADLPDCDLDCSEAPP